MVPGGPTDEFQRELAKEIGKHVGPATAKVIENDLGPAAARLLDRAGETVFGILGGILTPIGGLLGLAVGAVGGAAAAKKPETPEGGG